MLRTYLHVAGRARCDRSTATSSEGRAKNGAMVERAVAEHRHWQTGLPIDLPFAPGYVQEHAFTPLPTPIRGQARFIAFSGKRIPLYEATSDFFAKRAINFLQNVHLRDDWTFLVSAMRPAEARFISTGLFCFVFLHVLVLQYHIIKHSSIIKSLKGDFKSELNEITPK